MFGWLKTRVRRWLAADEPEGEKAATGATLTTYLGSPTGTTPAWNDLDTVRFNTGWVHASVRAIANRVAGQPVRVGRTGSATPTVPAKATKGASAAPPWMRPGTVKELPAHPVLSALHEPNPYLTAWGLLYLTVFSLELAGVAYLWVDRQPDGTTRVWYLPAGWVLEDPDADLPLSRFIVRPLGWSGEEFRLSSDELIRFSLPDPANPLAGLGPLKAGIVAVRTDQEVQTAQLAAFKNGARPGLLVTVGRTTDASPIGDPNDRPVLTKQQRKALTSQLATAYVGTVNSGEPLILDGFIRDVKPLSNVPAEVDFGGSSALTKERVTQLFGVNPIVLGQVEGANRTSATVADEHFCFTTCGPLCVLLGQVMTKFFRVFADDPALVVWVEPPKPRDPDGRRADLDQLARCGALTVDELRAEHGLAPLPDGAGAALVRATASPPPAADGARPDAPGTTRAAAPAPTVNVNVTRPGDGGTRAAHGRR